VGCQNRRVERCYSLYTLCTKSSRQLAAICTRQNSTQSKNQACWTPSVNPVCKSEPVPSSAHGQPTALQALAGNLEITRKNPRATLHLNCTSHPPSLELSHSHTTTIPPTTTSLPPLSHMTGCQRSTAVHFTQSLAPLRLGFCDCEPAPLPGVQHTRVHPLQATTLPGVWPTCHLSCCPCDPPHTVLPAELTCAACTHSQW
jgi:hypothetical protein